MSTYSNLKQHLENIFLINVLSFLKKSGSAPDTTTDEWIKIVSHMHDRGWLYYTKNDGQIVTIIGAYRIKLFEEDKIDIMPDKEEGNILFVNFAASTSSYRTVLKNMTREYLKNNPEVEEIVFYARNQDKKVTRIKIKGEKNVETKSERATTSTGVSSGTERPAEHKSVK